jgi:hypothetical protein
MISLEYPSKSPMLPAFNIKLSNTSISESLRQQLIDVVQREEPNIIKNIKSENPNEDPTWLTNKLWAYNFLDFDYACVKELKIFIYDSYINYMKEINVEPAKKVYTQCWVNILKNNGRRITPHHHADAHGKASYEYSYVSGNISINTENTSTYFQHPLFKEISSEIINKNGELIMFPSFVVHWTSENKSINPRITISFDLITEEVYNIIDNRNYRLLQNEI